MKRIFTLMFWTAIAGYLVLAYSFTSVERKKIVCTEINIIIEDSLSSRFYSQQDIEDIIRKGNVNILGYPLNEINTRKMEKMFHAKPYIKNAEIYTTMKGALTVRIKQRKPVIKIYALNGKSWYLDAEGYIMPESQKFAPYVLVANGNFPSIEALAKSGKLDQAENKDNYKEWGDALELANTINENDLWKCQIVQIYLNRQGIFEIFPRVGAHQIILGDVIHLEEKFEKLNTLYTHGLSNQGWNNYDKIDLRYKNQVVCTKR